MHRARKFAASCVRALAMLAVLCASVQTNHRYFYCEAMGLLQADPCAAVRSERDVAVTPTHEDCCRVVTLPSLPNATGTAAAFVIPPATLVAWTLPEPRIERTSSTWAPTRRSERDPPTPSRRRAELMIFLT